MPKRKAHKGAAKRFKVTGSGKVKHKKANLRHILTKRSAKQKRPLRAKQILCKSDEKVIKDLLTVA